MSRAFADIAFTPSVKAAQTRYGSREANLGFEMAPEKRDRLEARDIDFILKRDSFYQSTVSENGWPYVQHRGGPEGFLKIIDTKTLAYADFSGNAQYLSVGNLFANDKIALILVDYANRRRLKVWGRASIVHKAEQADLITKLADPTYQAPIERAVVITVEALEFNCPKHITPRYNEQEVQDFVGELTGQVERLKEQLAAQRQEIGSLKNALTLSQPKRVSDKRSNAIEYCDVGQFGR